jgi:thiamine-phosphate pyrophosphorylase
VILYYITDRKQFPGSPAEQRKRLLDTIRHSAEAGLDMVQLREKDLPVRELEALAREAVECVAGSATKLLVNSRIDVAIAAGAHSVHLPAGSEQPQPSEARVIFAKAGVLKPLIGISCHTAEEVIYAKAHGADFVVFGPVFGKAGVNNPAGLASLASICARPTGPYSKMAVLGLGGVAAENAPQLIAAGASGIAGIRLFQEAVDLHALVKRLRSLDRPEHPVPFRHPYQL